MSLLNIYYSLFKYSAYMCQGGTYILNFNFLLYSVPEKYTSPFKKGLALHVTKLFKRDNIL